MNITLIAEEEHVQSDLERDRRANSYQLSFSEESCDNCQKACGEPSHWCFQWEVKGNIYWYLK